MATGPSLGPGDVEDALAAYGPLTDVWQVVAAASGAVTVQLAKTIGAVPYIAPSLVPHYQGALVRFTTGALSGGGPGEQWNSTVKTIASVPTATTVTFGDTWPVAPSSGDQFTVIRGAGIGTNLSLASGTTVDVGTIAGAVTLASGTTVAIESGATVDVGTISGAITLASGSTIELTGNPTVDVSGQSIVIESSNTDIAVEGTGGSIPEPTGTNLTAVALGYYVQQPSADGGQFVFNPIGIVSPGNVATTHMTYLPVVVNSGSISILNQPDVTAYPGANRSTNVDVQSVAAGATASFSLASDTLYRVAVAAGGNGGGYVNIQLSGGSWLAACGVPGNANIDWSNSGRATNGQTISVYNAGSAAAQVMVAIEFT